MVLSTKDEKARKARDRGRQASAAMKRQTVALRRAGILQPRSSAVVTPTSGLDPRRIEATGTGRGGIACFRRCPNPALKHYLARAHITAKQYEAALHLYLVFEDASIPPGGDGPDPRLLSRRLARLHAPASRKPPQAGGAAQGGGRHKVGKLMIYDVCCVGRMLNEGSCGHFVGIRAKMACLKKAPDDLRTAYERMPQR